MILSLCSWRRPTYADTEQPRHFKIPDYDSGLLMDRFRILSSNGQISRHPRIRRMLIEYQDRWESPVPDSPCEPGWGGSQGRSRCVVGCWPSIPGVLWGSAGWKADRLTFSLSLGAGTLVRNPIRIHTAPQKASSGIYPQCVPNARRAISIEEPSFLGVLRSAMLCDTIGPSLSQTQEARASERLDLAVTTHRGDTRLRISVGCHARYPARRWETWLRAGRCHSVHDCDVHRSRKDVCKIDCLTAFRNVGRVRRGRRPANRRLPIHLAARVPAPFNLGPSRMRVPNT